MAQMNGMEKRNFRNSARSGGKTAEMRNNSAKSRMVGMSAGTGLADILRPKVFCDAWCMLLAGALTWDPRRSLQHSPTTVVPGGIKRTPSLFKTPTP